MKRLLFLIGLIILMISCKKDINIKVETSKSNQNKPFEVRIKNINNTSIDKINIKIDGKSYKDIAYNEKFLINFDNNYKLGKHKIDLIFTKDNDSLKDISFYTWLFAENPPKILKYKLVNAYPHDINAFIEGFEFYKDTLYESTGLNGNSSLRKEDVKTGKIYKKISLDKKYFGEGITVLNNKVYQLTWRSSIGFVYDTNFNFIKSFKFQNSKEGWGLCNDGNYIYKSDGTEKIWKLDPKTMKELNYISVSTNKHRIKNINELEWVNGKIFTNVWQKNAVAIINPKNGAVESIIDLSALHNKVTQHTNLDVLNGIAYNKKTGHLFVTGKMWDKVFEIEVEN